MIVHDDIVRIHPKTARKALEYGEDHPEPGHRSPMTGILRSAGRWILQLSFGLDPEETEPVMLRLQTTQVINRYLFVPRPFVSDGNKNLVVMYVHMPNSRLAPIDSVKGMTVAGWARASDIRQLFSPGEKMLGIRNANVLEPIKSLCADLYP